MSNTEENKEKKIQIDGEETVTAADQQQEETNASAETTHSEAPKEEDTKEQQDDQSSAEQQLEELKDKYLRTIAEFDNYKKRTLKEKTELILNGGEKTVGAILPVLDDFERALADKSEDPEAIREGVQMIFNKFIKTLENLGVRKIETEGQDFNVDYHEAVAMVPGMGDDKKGKVIDCMQTGYMLNDKVIRHAKVAVGQ